MVFCCNLKFLHFLTLCCLSTFSSVFPCLLFFNTDLPSATVAQRRHQSTAVGNSTHNESLVLHYG